MLNHAKLTQEELKALLDSGDFKQEPYTIFRDYNNNDIVDSGEEQYKVIIYYGRDGIKLKEIYQSIYPEYDQLLIFLENQEGDQFSDRRIYVRIGNGVRERFKTARNKPGIVGETVEEFLPVALDQSARKLVGKKVLDLVEATMGEVESAEDLWSLMSLANSLFLDGLEDVVNDILDLPINGLQAIIDGLRSLEFTPAAWDPSTATQNQSFTPFFFDFVHFKPGQKAYIIVQGKQVPVSKLRDSLLKGVDTMFNGVNNSADTAYQAFFKTLDVVTFGLADFGVPEHSPIFSLINSIRDFLKDAIDFLIKFVEEGLLFYNALLCGLINSLIEIFVGIFGLIQLVFMGLKGSANMLFKLRDLNEYMDNLSQALKDIDLNEVVKELSDFAHEVFGRVGSAVWGYLSSMKGADIGYCIGYIIGFIIEQALEAVFTAGIGNAGSIARTLGQGSKAVVDAFLEIIEKAMLDVGMSFKNLGKNIGKTINDLIRFVKTKSTKQLVDIIKKIKNKLMDWLDELSGIPKAVVKRYAKKYDDNGGLSGLVRAQDALRKHGKVGEKIVIAMDKKVQSLVKGSAKLTQGELNDRVMISGMAYRNGSKVTKVFTEMNFLPDEIGTFKNGKFLDAKGKPSMFQKFLDGMHPVLKKRLQEHLERQQRRDFNIDLDEVRKKRNDDSLTHDDLVRIAGMAGSHGEIRALDKVLKSISKKNMTDDVFENIFCYNRFLRRKQQHVQPRCLHCFYLTDGITMIV